MAALSNLKLDNELDPDTIYDFCLKQYQLFLKNLRQNSENQMSVANNLIQLIKHQNTILSHRIKSSLNEELRKKLELNLIENNNLIHNLLELNNFFLNNEQFYEWLRIQQKKEYVESETLIDTPANSAAENARKYRFYPHPTPFHLTPLKTNPYT